MSDAVFREVQERADTVAKNAVFLAKTAPGALRRTDSTVLSCPLGARHCTRSSLTVASRETNPASSSPLLYPAIAPKAFHLRKVRSPGPTHNPGTPALGECGQVIPLCCPWRPTAAIVQPLTARCSGEGLRKLPVLRRCCAAGGGACA